MEHPSVMTLMGTTGESSFTRTDTFDSSAITTGDSSFTTLSYSGTSPVSSLRFTSFLVQDRKDATSYDTLVDKEKDRNIQGPIPYTLIRNMVYYTGVDATRESTILISVVLSWSNHDSIHRLPFVYVHRRTLS